MKRFMLCNRYNTIFYGVIVVFGSPLIINSPTKGEGIVYNEQEILVARKALINAGIYAFRRVLVQENELIALDYHAYPYPPEV